MTPTATETRLQPRIKIDTQITYRLGSGGDMHQAELDNLSVSGACIWTQQKLYLGSRLHCRAELDVSKKPAIEFLIILVRIHPRRKGSLFGYGGIIEKPKSLD